MKHYVVVLDWAGNDEEDVLIIGVAHTLEEAKEIFAKQLIDEKKLADECGLHVETDTDTAFEAYESGYYAVTHSRLYIQEVNLYESTRTD